MKRQDSTFTFVFFLISETAFSLVICMFKIRKGRSNHAEEAEEKAEALFKRSSP